MGGALFEAVQFIEPPFVPGQPAPEPVETVLGVFPDTADAVDRCRSARRAFMGAHGRGLAWWLVRAEGATLAEWIADSSSDREFALDLRTQELVELR